MSILILCWCFMLLSLFIKRHKKSLFLITLLLVFVGIYALLIGVFTPHYLQHKLPALINEHSSLSLQIDEIRINPFYLSLEVKQVNLEGKNKQSLAAFERLYINFQLSSLFRQLWYFDAFILESPFLHYQIYSDLSTNIEQLETLIKQKNTSIKNSASENYRADSTADSAIPTLLVNKLRIDKLAVDFTDDSKEPTFKAHVGPLNLALDNFTTQKDLNSPYSLKATSASGIIGESFEWQGFITFLPFRSEGKFVIKEVNLIKVFQYVKDELPSLLTSGTLNFTANYRINSSQEQFLFDVENANVSFFDVFLKGKSQDLVAIELGEFLLSDVNYSSKSHQLSLGELAVNKSYVNLVINQQGTLNLSEMFSQWISPADKNQPSNDNSGKVNLHKGSPVKGSQLKLAIDNITFSDNNVLFVDNSTKKMTELAVSQIHMNMAGFNLQPSAYFPVNFSAVVEESGSVELVGDFSIFPLSSRFDISAKSLPVLSIEQYIQQFIISEIVGGEVNLAMKLNYQQLKNRTNANEIHKDKLTVNGDLTLNNWRTKLATEANDYARIKQVKLNGINYSHTQNTLDIEKMTLDNLWLNARRNDEGIINITNIHRPQKKPKQQDNSQSAQYEPNQIQPNLLSVNLQHLHVNSADIMYTDYAVSPRYKMQVAPLNMDIKGLSTEVDSRAEIDLSAKLNKFAPLSLKGSVNLLSDTLYTNFNLRLNDIQMSDMTPYSATFMGREIDQGKLNLDINYVIEEEQLRAENTVFIDQLELGNTVHSEQATSLPIGLAVSLLKDNNQEIHIDMPIRGNFNDPEFSYGQLVWQTLGNLIVKAVSSPFSLLAGLVNSDEDLSVITFVAGSTKLEEKMVKRLELLAQALNKRPELHLSITGCFHPDDREAFKNILLQQRINPESMVVSDSDYLLLLEEDYLKTMGASYQYNLNKGIAEAESLADKITQLNRALIDNVQVSDNQLVSLAQQRSRNIQQLLINEYQLTANRLVIGQIEALEVNQALSCALAPQG